MKGTLLGMVGLAGGAAYYMADTPDFDRVVKKRPIEVYAAFSRLAQEGVVTPPNQGPGPRVSFRVEKTQGQALRYEIRYDDRPVVEADLSFAPAGDDGRQTRLTAEIDVHAFELGSAWTTEAGVALTMVPTRLIDMQFARFMEEMVGNVEAGRPLPPLGTSRLGVRSARNPAASLSERRREAEQAQRAASRPMSRARPAVDPDADARRYLNGDHQNRAGGGWGR